MEEQTTETTQVNEEPKEQEVDLSGVEIVSNGETIAVDNKDTQIEETDDETTTEEQTDDEKETDTPAAEQADFQKAKGEIADAKAQLEANGVDFNALEEEYNENGELSKESYKLLEDKGYPKALVEAAIAGWQAKADAFANKIIEDAGGKRAYGQLQKFVAKQGAKAVATFNEIIKKSDLNVVSFYIAGIKAQMQAQHGTDNPTLGGAESTGKAAGFADAAEMVKAMSDPRYGKDAKYMQEVERKVAASKFF